jgi:HPt (histidine-containing phosphotransfer) domain-containing protein
VALTANALVQDIRNSQSAGCQAHLSKPISKQKLVNAIEQYGRAPSAESNREPILIEVPEYLEELVPAYLEARRNEVPVLLELLNASDCDRIRSLAHNIKGTGGGFGFQELTIIGTSLERAAKESNIASVKKHLQELSDYLERVRLPARR